MHVQLRAKPRRSLLRESVGVDGLEAVTHLGPLQGVADTVDDVVLRLPGQQAGRAVDPGISAGRVTWPPSGLESADLTVRHAGRRGRALASATGKRDGDWREDPSLPTTARRPWMRGERWCRGLSGRRGAADWPPPLCRLPSARPQRSPHGGFRASARIRKADFSLHSALEGPRIPGAKTDLSWWPQTPWLPHDFRRNRR